MNYAATDPLGRWVGLGRPLHALEIDYDFYNHETRITTLEASVTTTVSISSVTQPTATQMQINLSNSASYTLTMPTATFVDRSAWLPSTAYFVNDTFTANGSLYRVVFDHTSASTFSPTANDGAGHDFYAAMMSNPGNALPTGGAAAQVLQKSSSTDYAVSWGYKLPTGGTQYQVLMKNSSTNQDAAWSTLGASHISFNPSTASGLTSTDVASALEELDTLFQPATAAEYRSNVSGKVLTTDKVWSAAGLVTLTDAATIAVDMSTFINASVTLAGNRTLGNPSNTKSGQSGMIKVIQDATGSRTLAYASSWKFAGGTAPTLTTTAGAVDLLYYQVLDAGFIYATLVQDVR